MSIIVLWILKTNFRNVLESILDKSGLSIFHGQWENLCAKTKLISVIAPFHSVAFVKILFRNISNPPPPPWQKWIHVTIICFEYIFWFFDHETKTYEMPHCVPPGPPLMYYNITYRLIIFRKSLLFTISSKYLKGMVFCYQNCSDLLWEKIVLVIGKNFWNSRLKAENLQNSWDH